MARIINAYDRALNKINEQLLTMCKLVDQRLTQAMKALMEQDEELAKEVVAGDDDIDLLDEKLEMGALELFSLQQPVDHDLRFLAATMRIGHELERIGDYACDIAEIVLSSQSKDPYFKPLVDVPLMGELVKTMMNKSIKAYIKGEPQIAWELDDDDWEVDDLFRRLLAELTDYMKKGPEYVDQARNLLLVARYLERIGDHIVNIAEMTIFSVSGERQPFKGRKDGMLK
ncbi:MAG TPA: phosphate transport system regulatory protein PhoU [Firmicutes bacterium]|jgi:phosphate transport system protein|nr:phosphate transport system regulatory protein PhoU [Bacillota bacterium]HBT18355.1 phosphate transport system regulatory protein PhoU [Bacillota bacterium]